MLVGGMRCASTRKFSDEGNEALAQMQHDSWRIDRELDGWHYAPACDNRCLLHPDLVPYEQLRESTKDYARAQIRALWAMDTQH